MEAPLAFDVVGLALLAVIRQPTVAKEFHLECAAILSTPFKSGSGAIRIWNLVDCL